MYLSVRTFSLRVHVLLSYLEDNTLPFSFDRYIYVRITKKVVTYTLIRKSLKE